MPAFQLGHAILNVRHGKARGGVSYFANKEGLNRELKLELSADASLPYEYSVKLHPQ